MLKIAIPNKGALSEGAVKILKDAGYKCKRSSRELTVLDSKNNVEFIYLRPRDIAIYVANGTLDAGITGRDLAFDSQVKVSELLNLNFGSSRFFYALPKEQDLTPDDFEGLRIATSYPNIVKDDLKRRGIKAEVIKLDGAVEISIRLGVADVIADVVESGRTLIEAGLKTVGEPIMYSESVLAAHEGKEELPELQLLVQRVQGILVAREYVLLQYVAPKDKLEQVCEVTPGVKSPTINSLQNDAWVGVSAMVKRGDLNASIDALTDLGAHGIIAHNIQTCRI